MRVSILDLGTNTFNILIVEMNEDHSSYKVLYQDKLAVKLGEGGINKEQILPEPFKRGLDALSRYKIQIEKFDVAKVYAFATSAIRDAENGNDFVRTVHSELGFEINVISGEEEANLIFYGVRKAVTLEEKRSLIIDIGGGSVEFIIADKNKMYWKHSFQLGVARLLDKFKPGDPISGEQINEIKDFLQKELLLLDEVLAKYPVHELIGCSGSFDSLAEMIAYKFHSPEILNNVTEYEFDLRECKAIYEMIIKTSRAERYHIKGLVEMRVDMIVISSIIVDFVIERFNLRRFRLSTFALKEGVLEKILEGRI